MQGHILCSDRSTMTLEFFPALTGHSAMGKMDRGETKWKKWSKREIRGYYCWWLKSCTSWVVVYPLFTGVYTSQVVQDFSHQQYQTGHFSESKIWQTNWHITLLHRSRHSTMFDHLSHWIPMYLDESKALESHFEYDPQLQVRGFHLTWCLDHVSGTHHKDIHGNLSLRGNSARRHINMKRRSRPEMVALGIWDKPIQK